MLNTLQEQTHFLFIKNEVGLRLSNGQQYGTLLDNVTPSRIILKGIAVRYQPFTAGGLNASSTFETDKTITAT